MAYIAKPVITITEPCTDIAECLIEALQLSNGLEFMPMDQRKELIRLLSEPIPYITW